ncbi:SBBP repeat-containing protein [Candidatus Binatus sp.]|uniref:SBBP repeat-containing protein n=1 Tax=Candidatus Binatus sp. TaxID=2811406 RepID=UPI003BB1D6A5
MRFAKSAAVAALLLGVIGALRNAVAGSGSGKAPQAAIFVANNYDVTAYPVGNRGDVPPIAVTTDIASPNGIARDSAGRIYVANSATNTITVYAANAGGNVSPIAVIGGSNTGLADPIGVVLDASYKIYVLNGSTSSVTVYAPLDAGIGVLNEAPIATIAGSKTQLLSPADIAVTGDGEIYVANHLGGPSKPLRFAPGVVTIYAEGSNGNVTPTATISGVATDLVDPLSLALDSENNIYVANAISRTKLVAWDPSIVTYPAGSTGDAGYFETVNGLAAGIYYPYGIAVDSSGSMYTEGTSEAGDGISVIAAGSYGNVAPTTTIVGADTRLAGPNRMVLDSDRNLYVSNSFGGAGGGSVTVYQSGASSDAAPLTTITSDFTGIAGGASKLAMDSTGKIYVANFQGNGRPDSVTVYPAGSYAVGAPIATISGANTALSFPRGVGVDANGNISVLNDNGTVTTYAAGSSGNATPIATLSINSGKNTAATGLAVEGSGKIYVSVTGVVICRRRSCHQTSPGKVIVYRAGSDGNAKPAALISGPDTGLASPSALAVDQNGHLYVTNEGPTKEGAQTGSIIITVGPTKAGPGSITIYPPGSDDDQKPIATIAGESTKIVSPTGIALDKNGNIYVLDGYGASFGGGDGFFENVELFSKIQILKFAAGSNGDVAPIASVGGPFTGLNFPEGIAIGPTGP